MSAVTQSGCSASIFSSFFIELIVLVIGDDGFVFDIIEPIVLADLCDKLVIIDFCHKLNLENHRRERSQWIVETLLAYDFNL